MTQPAVGTTFNGAGFNDRAPEFLRRGRAVGSGVRDARGAATDISPHNPDGSVRWSPFAQDGKWRADLYARRKVNGIYTTVVTPNQGFYGLGAFKKGDGPAWDPKISNDDFMILQDTQPYDTEIVEESEAFNVTPVDTADPVIQRLRNNLPLSDGNGNPLVEDPGAVNTGFGRVLNAHNRGRQFFFVRERLWDGLPIYSFTAVALAKLDNRAGMKMDDKDSEAERLTYKPLPDGRFMAMQDGEYQPVLVYTWWGGAGLVALGGIPQLSSTPPTATATTAAHATLAFPQPTGPGDPWEYAAQQSTDAGTTWGTAITPTNVAVNSGVVTLTLAGLTAGASRLRATVKGTNGAVATTPNSASVTIT